MRLVLFLGAGFSAAAGLPVMKDFARHVRGLPGCDEDEHMCLRACINYAKATCAFIDGDIENFEHVMSVISLAAITSPDASLPTKHMRTTFARAIQVLQRLVWRVYQRLEPLTGLGAYQDFFGKIQDFRKSAENSLGIITTNYDMLAETLLIKTGQRYAVAPPFEDFTREPIPDGTHFGRRFAQISGGYPSMYTANEEAKVHKLHGSVNWFATQGNSHVEGQEEVVCYDQVLGQGMANTWLERFPYAATKDASIPTNKIPLIIPPSMVKHYAGPVIQEAWRGAAKAIAHADRVIFIGYSFPQTDTIMKYFLGTALASNDFVARVAVIDKYPDRIKPTLKDIFPKSRFDSIDFREVDFPDIIDKANKPFGEQGFGAWLAS